MKRGSMQLPQPSPAGMAAQQSPAFAGAGGGPSAFAEGRQPNPASMIMGRLDPSGRAAQFANTILPQIISRIGGGVSPQLAQLPGRLLSGGMSPAGGQNVRQDLANLLMSRGGQQR